MATNEILPFASTDTGTNLLTQAEYTSDAQRPIGNQPGIARSKLVNKALRQTTIVAAAVADYAADYQEANVTDGLSTAALKTIIAKGFRKGVQATAIANGGGTVNAITATFSPAITELFDGLVVFVKATGANTSTTPTFTPNNGTIAAKAIVKGSGSTLAIGDIDAAGMVLMLQYSSTLDKWLLQNPAFGIKQLGSGRINVVVDGACRMAQLAAKSLTTGYQYGRVDMFAARATGTAVTAGTITQSTSAPIGQEGFSLHISGATITGSGIVYARHRVESAFAKTLQNRSATFSVQVHHDTGSAKNYTIILRAANGLNNFSSVTQIAASSAISVPNATATKIEFQNVSMGNCGNGIEIEVQCASGAVTTKNFHFTEWQLEQGSSATNFARQGIQETISDVERYLEKSYDLDVLPGTITFTGAFHSDASQVSDFTVPFRSRKLFIPGVTYYSALSGNSGTIAFQNTIGTTPQGDIPVQAQRIGTNSITVQSDPGDVYMPIVHFVADARL